MNPDIFKKMSGITTDISLWKTQISHQNKKTQLHIQLLVVHLHDLLRNLPMFIFLQILHENRVPCLVVAVFHQGQLDPVTLQAQADASYGNVFRLVVQNAGIVMEVLQESGGRTCYGSFVPHIFPQEPLQRPQVMEHVFVRMRNGHLELQHAHYQKFSLNDRIPHVPVFVPDFQRAVNPVQRIMGDIYDVANLQGIVLYLPG